MKLSVVVPCYRSAASLPILIERLEGVVTALSSKGTITQNEIIFVVDGSPDNTAEVAHVLQARFSNLTVIELTRNFGQHNALLAGISHASGDVIVTLDDDLQHSPEDIPQLINKLSTHEVDLVYGISRVEEHGFFRSVASRTAKQMFKALGVSQGSDISAFRAFSGDLLPLFAAVQSPVVSIDVVLSWGTKRITSCPVDMSPREIGSSGYSFRALVRYMMNVILGFSTLPLKLATWLGSLAALGAVVFGIYTLIIYFSTGISAEGFTTLAILIAFFGGVQLFSLGIIGEYLGRIFMKQIGQPPYNIRNITPATAVEFPE